MIRLARRRTGTSVPAAFREPKLTATAAKLVDIFYAGQPSGKYAFDSAAWKPAKTALKRDTGDKCAYCEAPTAVVAHGDVEHFRPKSIYWWLAFCFDNYLFSCQICNQKFKGDKFPLAAAAISAPVMPQIKPPVGAALDALVASLIVDASLRTDDEIRTLWAQEDADIVNPYLEDPELLMQYEADPDNEEILVRSTGGARADRAMAAAESALGLNREELRRVRYAHYLPFATLKLALDEPISAGLRQLVTRQVRTMQGAREPFAGMFRHFARGWGLPGPL